MVLSGGNTLFPGLRERMQREMQRLAPDDASAARVKVLAPAERKCAYPP